MRVMRCNQVRLRRSGRQSRALLQRCRGALLLRRHLSDAESDRRQSHHRPRRLRVRPQRPAIRRRPISKQEI
jgi:predicted LPLAT superfamily acyltransferase